MVFIVRSGVRWVGGMGMPFGHGGGGVGSGWRFLRWMGGAEFGGGRRRMDVGLGGGGLEVVAGVGGAKGLTMGEGPWARVGDDGFGGRFWRGCV